MQRNESLFWVNLDCDAGAFLQSVNPVDGEIGEIFSEAAGPADFDGVELRDGAETEVDADVAVRVVAGTAADFVDEEAGAGFHGDASADSVAR